MYFSRKAFTLIELLVVIAVIAILSVVVILTLNPAELLRQSRDANRVSDMDTLAHALGIYSTDVTSGNLGIASTIYVSIPDPSATSTAGDQCQGLGLVSAPSGYTYHCAASSTNRNIDGTGWIPVNLKLISSGSPIGDLPVDPTNNSSTDLYYTYTTNGTQYEVAAPSESQKYRSGGASDIASTDGGTKLSLIEKGTNLTLEPVDYGDQSLLGYWGLDEGTGTIAYNYAGNNTTGTWNGTPTGTIGNYSAGKVGPWAGAFDGATDYVRTGSLTLGNAFTASAWVYPNNTATGTYNRIVENNFNIGFYLGTGGATQGNYLFVVNNSNLNLTGGTVVSSTWQFVAGTYDGTTATLYVNGVAVRSFAPTAPGTLNLPIYIGNVYTGGAGYWRGNIDDVRVYNRALSAAEIQALYNGQK